MTTEEIIDSIYYYYPKNVSLDDGYEYDLSIEYQRRLQKCKEAREDNNNWINFKEELNAYFFLNFRENVSDYSILGTEPCYCHSINLI